MPNVSLDMSNVQQRTALPKGDYECIISSVKYGLSKAENKPTIYWEFTVAEGESEGRKFFMSTSLELDALWKLQQVFEGLGLDPKYAGELEFDDDTNLIVEPNIIGLPVLCSVVADREWQGRKQNDVVKVQSASQITGGANGKSGKKSGYK